MSKIQNVSDFDIRISNLHNRVYHTSPRYSSGNDIIEVVKKHWLIFFLDDFHHGAINHVIHFIGFTVLGYGLGKPSLLLIVLSPFIMELGHFYNYARGIHKEHALKIIPLQWLAWIIFVLIGFGITNILE